MKKLIVIETDNTVPYHNLALEEALLNIVKEGECILYLWQNRQTVVIGRNQNALNECRIQKLEADGGFLARRLSGGGAVYHDLGNLNFTFIACSDDYDKMRQTQVILNAVRSAGINAEINGRNDLTVDGRKFSGHAYYKTKNKCYHHGTIMLNVDKTVLSDYLNVSKLKLSSKGVKSVKSRVVNLNEIVPELSVEEMKKRLVEAFSEVYALPVSCIDEKDIDKNILSKLEKRYASSEWKYAGEEVLPFSAEERFNWGQARLDYNKENGVFSKVRFYSDGLDADYLSEISQRLTGCRIEKSAVINSLSENTEAYSDIALTEIINDISMMIFNNETEAKI